MNRAALARHIPHAEPMCLLDGVVDWDAQSIRCIAESHRKDGHPLACNGFLPAVAGIEYAAQAMAVHGSLTGSAPRPSSAGYLASVRDVTLRAQRLDELTAPLIIDAVQLLAEGAGVIYDFTVSCAEVTVLSGRAAVVLQVPDL